ncbi:type I restriction-modification system subunit M [Owenweeksia hongkongensis]|uniref:type I restriction-modification system subunit M n=1 Tax=Owenweeksia hongkongensis TaxID=253245 RepID=UPI003A8DF760
MSNHSDLIAFIWNIANKLRGPYRPPQYRRVMLPMIVLRRMDCVLEDSKDAVLAEYEKLKARGLSEDAITKILGQTASEGREQPLYNTSPFTFAKLLADADGIARNLTAYINGFAPKAREIFEKFDFEKEIEKLNDANRLYTVVTEFAKVDLHPDKIENLQMGYVFEELVRKFNEQANEEAGDHFTPREVIQLMAKLTYHEEEVAYTPNIVRTIYDPTCGTGGMLSVSEELIRKYNPDANLMLFGQEYNNESYAICCADLLIKDESPENVIFGDTLGDGKSSDGHPEKKFHYMLANPPFGVEWKEQKRHVESEFNNLGFKGRFGPGLPRINDGALLFLLHMLSKVHPGPEVGGDGSKIAVVFNGSPLFTGDAGSGESNIRRWIIENDWLDTIIALPNQLFYNTGIFTYVWLVSNKKPQERKGKVQLVDATQHFVKMDKSLGDKRNKISDDQIDEIVRLYADYSNGATSEVLVDGEAKLKDCVRIFPNQEFGYLKVTVERPLRLNFLYSKERIERLKDQTAFSSLAISKKRKDAEAVRKEEEEGRALQKQILDALYELESEELIMDRKEFLKGLDKQLKAKDLKLGAPLKKAIIAALGERDPEAAVCTDAKGKPEPDSELRDTELIPLPHSIPLPLPVGYDKKSDISDLLNLVKTPCEEYFEAEVLPHVPDAWIDYTKTKVGYEIPINRYFYEYQAPRSLAKIETELAAVEGEILEMLKDLKV